MPKKKTPHGKKKKRGDYRTNKARAALLGEEEPESMLPPPE